MFLSKESGGQRNNRLSFRSLMTSERDFGFQLAALREQIALWKKTMTIRIKELTSKYGALNAKAFPGRAAVLIKLLDLDHEIIKAVYERPNSMKIGHFVPGTRIPIKCESELFAMSPSPPVILNLAWHISAEIRDYLKQHGFFGDVVDILEPKDFVK